MGIIQKSLSNDNRIMIAQRWAAGKSPCEIAAELGFSQATIYTELKRGRTGRLDKNKRFEYDPEIGLTVYQENLRKRGRKRKEERKYEDV